PHRHSSPTRRSSDLHRALVALLAEGHLLIEDVPGVGKTMLARALAATVDATVRRIQFTPDLLPGDVTGVSVFNPVEREFEFKRRSEEHTSELQSRFD